MVLQQCLACNTRMPGSCRSCICGHVFEDLKQIGGKRFSGYRAELYNRLETKRLKSMMKQIQRSEGLGSSDEENTDVNAGDIAKYKSPQSKSTLKTLQFYKTQRRKPQNRRRRRKRLHRGPASSSSQSLGQKDSRQISPELVARLPNALSEINRRLLGQNMLWAGL